MRRKFEKVPSAEQLAQWYSKDRRSLRWIEKETGASGPTVRAWLKAAGVTTRTISEGKKGQKPAFQTVLASVKARRKRILPGRPDVGYKVNEDGYVLLRIPGHPMADGQGYVKEHRLVLAQALGRALLPEEDGHHKNHVRHDNRPENLELKATHAGHMREHAYERSREGNGRFA